MMDIKIKIGDCVVGIVGEVTVNQEGSEYTGSCDRVRFDQMRVAEVFNGFVHAHTQRLPFDIEINDLDNSIISTVKNAWITGPIFTQRQNDWIVSDKMNFEAEAMFSGNDKIAEI